MLAEAVELLVTLADFAGYPLYDLPPALGQRDIALRCNLGLLGCRSCDDAVAMLDRQPGHQGPRVAQGAQTRNGPGDARQRFLMCRYVRAAFILECPGLLEFAAEHVQPRLCRGA
jgi:hypothetical protein